MATIVNIQFSLLEPPNPHRKSYNNLSAEPCQGYIKLFKKYIDRVKKRKIKKYIRKTLGATADAQFELLGVVGNDLSKDEKFCD